MPKCIVVADDLTGANATGVLLKKMEYTACTVLNKNHLDGLATSDCVLYPTDSRGVSKEIAYKRVYEGFSMLKSDEVKVYSKRIDSTLRGNLGSEADAVIDCLGDDYIAIVAPCFPSSGRIVIGGYMLVNGIPLHKTDAALDPKTPVNISEVEVLFKEQSKYKVKSVFMKDMMNGKYYLSEILKTYVAEGVRIICVDCVTEEDLDLIADAVILSKLKVACIDPGVFTSTLARKLIVPSKKEPQVKNKILVVVGSVNQHAKIQMENLWLSQKHNNVFVETKLLLDSDQTREEEIKRVVSEILTKSNRNSVSTVTGNGIYPENRINLEQYATERNCTIDDITEIINSGFAEITYRIFKAEKTFQGLYTSGGDITVAVCSKFQTVGLDLVDEVLPLAAYGQCVKGEFGGVHMITKGGSQGERDAINQCVTYLKEKLHM